MNTLHADAVLRHPALWLALLAAAQFIIAVDYNIVYMALPSIGAALAFSPSHLQWVVSAYALAFGGLLLLGSRLGDLFGRRRSFIAALLLYAVSSLAGGLAGSQALLVGARAMQGIGGALLFPATLALIATYFQEGPDRHRALAIMGAAGASGGAAGALLGGLLTSGFGWHATFFINVPIAAAVALAAVYLLPRERTSSRPLALDLPGAISATTGLVLLVLACIEGPELGWLSLPVLAFFTGAAILLALFINIENHTSAPLMPLRLLRHPNLSTGMLICALFAAAFGAQYFLLTTYLQQVRLLSPSAAGMAFLPFALSIVIGTRLGGRLLKKVGLRAGLLIGLGMGFTGLVTIALNLDPRLGYGAHLLPGFIFDGLGQGITWTLMWVVATSGIANEDRGIASGMASTAQQVGNALGLALLAGVATWPFATDLTGAQQQIPGIRAAFLTAAGVAALVVLVVLVRLAPAPAPPPAAALRPE